jgi:alkylhydroperoxidase family enzyme
MARVKLVQTETASPAVQSVFERIQSERGIVGNLLKVIAHNPTFLEPLIGLGEAVRKDIRLDRRTQELAIMLLAYLNQAPYEWAHHRRRAIDLAVTPRQIADLPNWQESDQFDARDRAVLRCTEEITLHANLSDEAAASARDHFDEQEFVELVVTVSLYNMITRIGSALDVDLESMYGPEDRLPARKAPRG